MPNYIDEFRNSKVTKALVQRLKNYKVNKLKIMEICGTHTMAISRFGIRSILPKGVKLISGPGCPVCVTPSHFINAAFHLAEYRNNIILTFGDMMRIPKDGVNLLDKKAEGNDIRIIYSPLDSIKIAQENLHKNIILLSVGFETTTPIIALTIDKAKKLKLKNFFALTANKTIPQVMELLANDDKIGIDAFLYPGHVSTIIGTDLYTEILRKFSIPGAVAGFEPSDILIALDFLIDNHYKCVKEFKNIYNRAVKPKGNELALETLNKVFEPCDAVWRGIGNIPLSGLKLNDNYSEFDAWLKFKLDIMDTEEPTGCMCGEILKGKKLPIDCKLFQKICTPQNPVGACMVSSEGTCAAYYKYERVQK